MREIKANERCIVSRDSVLRYPGVWRCARWLTIRVCNSVIALLPVFSNANGNSACTKHAKLAFNSAQPKPPAVTKCSEYDSPTDAGCSQKARLTVSMSVRFCMVLHRSDVSINRRSQGVETFCKIHLPKITGNSRRRCRCRWRDKVTINFLRNAAFNKGVRR